MTIKEKIGLHTLFVSDKRDDNRALRKYLKSLTVEGIIELNQIANKRNKDENILNIKRELYRPRLGNIAYFENDGTIDERKIQDICSSYNYTLIVCDNSVFNKEIDNSLVDLVKQCLLIDSKTLFIGDIHENLNPLNKLIENHANANIVIMGDYLDKGGDTLNTIDVIYELYKNGSKVIIGNHEYYVARRLNGEVQPTIIESEVFTSVNSLLSSEEHRNKFMEIFNNSIPFGVLKYNDQYLWATHAPCKTKYLGKHCYMSIRKQRNFYFKNREQDKLMEQLNFLTKPLPRGHKHIFGHVAHDGENIEHNGRYWIDTGSVYGNKLSGLLYENGEIKIVQSDSNKELIKDKLINIINFQKELLKK